MSHENGERAGVLTLVVDNVAGGDFIAEHGFSAWIEVSKRRILFDTGQGEALENNARVLGIDLAHTDDLVLSHGHYDHTGGIPFLLENASNFEVYAHPSTTRMRYSIRPDDVRDISMPLASRKAMEGLPSSRMHWVEKPSLLMPNVGVSGPIPRIESFEDVGGPFFLDESGSQPDPIVDDMALWIHTTLGLLVVFGCAHAGLINTLRHIQSLTGQSKIHTVIGGFHLKQAGEERLQATMQALEALDVERIVPCHCTGEKATERLKEYLGTKVLPGEVGMEFRFTMAQGMVAR